MFVTGNAKARKGPAKIIFIEKICQMNFEITKLIWKVLYPTSATLDEQNILFDLQ